MTHPRYDAYTRQGRGPLRPHAHGQANRVVGVEVSGQQFSYSSLSPRKGAGSEAVRAQNACPDNNTHQHSALPNSNHYNNYHSRERGRETPRGWSSFSDYPPTFHTHIANLNANATLGPSSCSYHQELPSGAAAVEVRDDGTYSEYPLVYSSPPQAEKPVELSAAAAMKGAEETLHEGAYSLLTQILHAFSNMLTENAAKDAMQLLSNVNASANLTQSLQHPCDSTHLLGLQLHQPQPQGHTNVPSQPIAGAHRVDQLAPTHFTVFPTEKQQHQRQPRPQRSEHASQLMHQHQLLAQSVVSGEVGQLAQSAAVMNRRLILIEGKEDLVFHAHAWAQCKAIAVDVKGYQDRSCILQISTETEDFIIDTLRLWHVMPSLHALFASPSVVKIFHDANHDIKWLKRDFGIEMNGLFDTYIASGIMLRSRGQALWKIIEARWGTQPEFEKKTKKKHNWSFRPLNREMLEHARMDTSFLFAIYTESVVQLMAMGGFEDVVHKSQQVAVRAKKYAMMDPPRFICG